MNRQRKVFALIVGALLASAPAFGQGPASCGFHLDVRCDLTGTHSAVADMPSAPGGGGIPYGPGVPGNPYSAYATPGSPMAITISGNSLAYGPAPMGPGSCMTLLYSVGAVMAPIPLAAPFVPPCIPGSPTVIGILPILGAIFDACGIVAPLPPFVFPVDIGGGRYTFFGTYPPFAPPGLSFQAVGITPGGAIWLTNAVTIFPGMNPGEVPVPFPIACGILPGPSEGQAVGLPTPIGFTFYGFPALGADMDVNGFVDFVPGVGPGIAGGCDTTGAVGDLGCPVATATARPRIEVNHADYDLTIPPAPPFVPGMTMEFRPPGPAWPDAWIYRWKNAPAAGSPPGIAGLATAALAVELHGGMCPCIPPIMPGRIAVVRSWLIAADQCGIGPGLAPQGYGGPPAALLPSTCGFGAPGLAFMGTFAPPLGLPYLGLPGGAIHMDLAASSTAVFNSAVTFTPMPGPPPVAYTLVVY